MSEDQPLTEFQAGEDSSETAHIDEEGEDPNIVEPAAVTYRCRPDGFVCTTCGAETIKQWLDSGEFVCPDCKSWT